MLFRSKGKIRTILLPGKLCKKLLKYARKQKITSGEIFLTGGRKMCIRDRLPAGEVQRGDGQLQVALDVTGVKERELVAGAVAVDPEVQGCVCLLYTSRCV